MATPLDPGQRLLGVAHSKDAVDALEALAACPELVPRPVEASVDDGRNVTTPRHRAKLVVEAPTGLAVPPRGLIIEQRPSCSPARQSITSVSPRAEEMDTGNTMARAIILRRQGPRGLRFRLLGSP